MSRFYLHFQNIIRVLFAILKQPNTSICIRSKYHLWFSIYASMGKVMYDAYDRVTIA
jgi:hypothetical protein